MQECTLVLAEAVRSSLGTSQTQAGAEQGSVQAGAQSPRTDIVDTLDPSPPHASPV